MYTLYTFVQKQLFGVLSAVGLGGYLLLFSIRTFFCCLAEAQRRRYQRWGHMVAWEVLVPDGGGLFVSMRRRDVDVDAAV